MARVKSFSPEAALDAAIAVFADHGYEGASAAELTGAMGIGRQSLYDTFGDKWQLYLDAVRRYGAEETQRHLAALASRERAIDAIAAVVARVVRDAATPCLGVQATCEFGNRRDDLNAARGAVDRALRSPLLVCIREAQGDGDIDGAVDPDDIAAFLFAGFTGIRLAARGGASQRRLAVMGDLLLKGLR